MSQFLSYLSRVPLTIPEVLLVSLLYLLVDIYPQTKSFKAMLTTASFLLLWSAFATLTGIAYFFLTTTSLAKVQGLVGPVGAKLTIIVLAALMGATILQSLALKISDVKIINLQALLDDYRRQVLEDINRRNSKAEKARAFELADRLERKFTNNVGAMIEEYSQLLIVTLSQPADRVRELQELDMEALGLNISKLKLTSLKMARMDADRCRQLLNRR